MDFKLGDKVRCIRSDKYRKLDGKFGTVVEVSGAIVGVEFDEEIDGHTLGGLVRMGHGWYLPTSGGRTGCLAASCREMWF